MVALSQALGILRKKLATTVYYGGPKRFLINTVGLPWHTIVARAKQYELGDILNDILVEYSLLHETIHYTFLDNFLLQHFVKKSAIR